MSDVGPAMRSERGPAIEQIVSARAWRLFPELESAAFEWAGLAGAESSDLVVSAVPIGMDWVSVRVSRLDGPDDQVVDWIEWLAPLAYKGACQPAVDHFAARALDGAATSLRGRDGQLRGVADFPPVPAPGSGSEGMITMAKKAPEPAPKKTPAKTPAKMPAATAPAARSRKPAAATPPPAKAARSAPAAKPAPPPAKAARSAPAAKPAPASSGGKAKTKGR